MTSRALSLPKNRPADAARWPLNLLLDDASIDRIEEWVVSTLDDRTRNSAETDWMASLDGLTLTKRSPQSKNDTAKTSAEPVGWSRFRLSKRRGIAIVSLVDQALVKEEDLVELTGDIRALVEAGHRRIVLDFFAVERLSSWAARMLDDAVRDCLAAEGSAIKFSGLKPEVIKIFAMTGLDPRVASYPDTVAAVGGSWPELPALRPLPVSILSALMSAEEARSKSSFRPDPTRPIAQDLADMTTAHLVIQTGRLAGQPIPINGVRFVIGRGGECDFPVKSAQASRLHAAIDRRGSRFYLRDLASTNGTLLNGKILRSRETEIRDGDTIRVGNVACTLRTSRTSRALSVRDEQRPELFPLPLDEPDEIDRPVEVASHEPTEEFVDLSDLGEEIGLKYEVIEGVLVVTPITPDLDDQAEVDGLRLALISLAQRRLPDRVVINLMNVGHLSGKAIGVLVAHHLRLDRTGGALRVCLANPRVAVVLEQIKLGMIVDYHPTVEDAVIAAWPEPSKAIGRA